MAADIFISYRGADRALARKLEYRLRSRWGSRVFRDETGVTSGRDWVEELNDAMGQARVIIAVVGPGWNISDDENVEDWVRKELRTAVEDRKPILAVLVGDSEKLRPKLAAMPEAFRRQAVVVGPELAGFDIHNIAKAVKQLGAFRSDSASTLSSRRDEMVPKKYLSQATDAIEAGKSLLIIGASGSGRNALIKRLSSNLEQEGHLVASYGVERPGGSRHTHAVIAEWVQSLSEVFQDLNSPFSVREAKQALVRSVLNSGPDLLSRKVVKASTLLPLGGTQHDQKILEAVRRSTDRWAPFPPKRLRHQSRAVIENLWRGLNKQTKSILGDHKLILVVEHFDSVDSISGELVLDLVQSPIGENVQFIIAAYRTGLNARQETNWLEQQSAGESAAITKITFEDTEQDPSAWSDHIQPWLDAHGVKLAPLVEKRIRKESNPYRALSILWYLVDNGFVKEPKHVILQEDEKQGTRRRTKKQKVKVPAAEEDGKVTWSAVGEGESLLQAKEDQITDDLLLEHMIEEHIPVRFRKFVEVGALIGRTFSFHAAYAATHPPDAKRKVDEPLRDHERDQWRANAEKYWHDLKTIDPDKSVLSCTESDTGEYLVSLAKAELIGHLRNQISPQVARKHHERLARYLVNPLEELDQKDYGDRYYRADLAAKHWTLASRSRDAADAHRNAAEEAEKSLAYGEARKHYHKAIRLYTQLLAEHEETNSEHEDLLILANCYYRIGQMTRLSGNPHNVDEDSLDDQPAREWGAINYLQQASKRLAELRKTLLENNLDHCPERITSRGIPIPNLVRHHLRVYNAVSGHVNLEWALCHNAMVSACRARQAEELHSCEQCRNNRRSIRDRLFDALRHAEAAQGEAGSRWLLAEASAQLAALLADESLRIQKDDPQRANELAVEAFFHIERIIGLDPYTKKEKKELADPVSLAWRSAGRLFRHGALQARIAEWCFRKMNDHGPDVTATVDMITDRWLGGFLLSICEPGGSKATIDESRKLLMRHRKWATESGLVDQNAPAHLRLYLLELVASANDLQDAERRQARREHLANARKSLRIEKSDQQERDVSLYQALEKIITPDTSVEQLVGRLQAALALDDGEVDSPEATIQKGAVRLAGMLLRRCPLLCTTQLVKQLLQRLIAEPAGSADADRQSSGSENLHYWMKRAHKYADSLEGERLLSPCVDTIPHIESDSPEQKTYSVIKRLAEARLPTVVFRQAERTASWALKLLETHAAACEREEEEHLDILRRDVEYAAFMHDWYRGTDPARLLTLASEWNLAITGEEWSNPRVLQGRLASTVLKKMYDAEAVLGQSRYRRITNMVENCVVGEDIQTALGKIFFLANAISDRLYKDPYEQENKAREWLIDKLGLSIEQDWEPDRLTVSELQIGNNVSLDDVYQDVIKNQQQGLWELGYTTAAEEQSIEADAPSRRPLAR